MYPKHVLPIVFNRFKNKLNYARKVLYLLSKQFDEQIYVFLFIYNFLHNVQLQVKTRIEIFRIQRITMFISHLF